MTSQLASRKGYFHQKWLKNRWNFSKEDQILKQSLDHLKQYNQQQIAGLIVRNLQAPTDKYRRCQLIENLPDIIFSKEVMRFLYKKRRNAKICIKRREQLIKTVLEDNKSISYAAKKMRIRYSTARFIVHKYATTGLVDPKPLISRPEEHLETPSEDHLSQPSSVSLEEVLPNHGEEQPLDQSWVPNPVFMGYVSSDGGFLWSPYYSWGPF